MLYLLDANVLITAHNTYYPLDDVPEFWDWLVFQGEKGHVRIPIEVWDELKGNRIDPFRKWIAKPDVKDALLFKEDLDGGVLNRVVYEGYEAAPTDVTLEKIGADAYLIAYAMFDFSNRCVITGEVSRPGATGKNRKVPDVCKTMGVQCRNPFEFNKALGFKTWWKLDHGLP